MLYSSKRPQSLWVCLNWICWLVVSFAFLPIVSYLAWKQGLPLWTSQKYQFKDNAQFHVFKKTHLKYLFVRYCVFLHMFVINVPWVSYENPIMCYYLQISKFTNNLISLCQWYSVKTVPSLCNLFNSIYFLETIILCPRGNTCILEIWHHYKAQLPAKLVCSFRHEPCYVGTVCVDKTMEGDSPPWIEISPGLEDWERFGKKTK